MARLTLLDGLAWDGRPLPGGKVVDLLSALALAGPRGLSDGALLDQLWEATPAGGAKALHVVVARTRSATAAAAVARTEVGYRLDPQAVVVDAWELTALADQAAAAADPVDVADLWERAPAVGPSAADTLLSDVRQTGVHDRDRLRIAVGIARSKLGQHEQALPLLDVAVDQDPTDDRCTAAYLRAVAALHGPAAALTAYGRIRSRLVDALGVDPSPLMQQLHAEFLAADRPVRVGVAADSTGMVGRERTLLQLQDLLDRSRVVTVLGSGGLGKTTLAQAAARSAHQPVVQVVPLVGVTDGSEVVAAVADALGARDSVGERRDRNPATVTGRIAAALTGPPVLLVLDNCEQVVEAVADLVAFLVAAVPALTVLTTSRRPLAIAAERVLALDPLTETAAVDLFNDRARAVRPGVVLPVAEVTEIVRRLDGVPLAIHLAAAQIRHLSVRELLQGLDSRFETLRGGLRDAPDRHRTLQAVIEWSWELLGPTEQRALSQLAVFHTPFGRAAATAVLAGQLADSDVVAQVLDRLVDHSLVVVEEGTAGVRLRMLETVREFGLLQLAHRGERVTAERAVRDWAIGFVRQQGPALHTGDEASALASLVPELPELVEILRFAVAGVDLEAVLGLAPTLSTVWLQRGSRARASLVVECGEVLAEHLSGLPSTPELLDATRDTVGLALLINTFMIGQRSDSLRAALAKVGPGTDPRISAVARIAMVLPDDSGMPTAADLEVLTDHPDRLTRRLAWQWLIFLRENLGDFDGALSAAQAALAATVPADAPSFSAGVHSIMAQLLLHVGRGPQAQHHAEIALAEFDRLHASEDATEIRAVLALHHLREGQIVRVAADLDRWPAQLDSSDGVTSPSSILPRWVRAELLLAQGRIDEGLAQCLDVVADADNWFPPEPDGLSSSPWSVGALMAATVVHAAYPDRAATKPWLIDRVLTCGLTMLSAPRVDYPLTGSLLYSVAVWRMFVDGRDDDQIGLLLALSERFGHGATLVTLTWEEAVTRFDGNNPGRLAAVGAPFAGLRGPALLAPALAALTAVSDR